MCSYEPSTTDRYVPIASDDRARAPHKSQKDATASPAPKPSRANGADRGTEADRRRELSVLSTLPTTLPRLPTAYCRAGGQRLFMRIREYGVGRDGWDSRDGPTRMDGSGHSPS